MNICPSCYSTIKKNTHYCPICRHDCTAVLSHDEQQAYNAFSRDLKRVYGARRKLSGHLRRVVVLLSILAVVAVSFAMTYRPAMPCELYEKDGKLVVYNAKTDVSTALCTALSRGDVWLTDDGERVFYPIVSTAFPDGIYNLSLKACNTADGGEVVAIDDNIRSYVISEDGDAVVYLTADGTLHSKTYRGGERIAHLTAKNVTTAWMSIDGERVVYLTDTNRLMTWVNTQNGAKATKKALADDVAACYFADETLQTCYYLTVDGTLYHANKNGESTKLAQQVSSVIMVSKTGGCYFTKDNEAYAPKLSNFVYDDNPGVGDASINEYITTLNETTYTLDCTALYYYQDNTVTTMTKAFAHHEPFIADRESGVLAYQAYHYERIDQKPLSRAGTIEQLKESINVGMAQCLTTYTALDGTAASTDITLVGGKIGADGKTMVYIGTKDNVSYLGRISLKDGVVVTNNRIVDGETFADATSVLIDFLADGTSIVSVDGVLYADTVEIASDVMAFTVNNDGTEVAYTVGETKRTLHCYTHDGGSQKITDKVSRVRYMADDSMSIVVDSDPTTYQGNLMRYHRGKLTAVADNVTGIELYHTPSSVAERSGALCVRLSGDTE